MHKIKTRISLLLILDFSDESFQFVNFELSSSEAVLVERVNHLLLCKVEELVELEVKTSYSVIMELSREPRPIRDGIVAAQFSNPVLLLPIYFMVDVVRHAASPNA